MHAKKFKIAILATVIVVIGAVAAIKLFPVVLMYIWERSNRSLGRADHADDIYHNKNRLEEETNISKYFDGADVTWVELPRSYSGVASTKYLELFPENFTISMITTPDSKFVMCVPTHLKDSFTMEALDEYQESQQASTGQAATRSESEEGDEPQPEAEEHPR